MFGQIVATVRFNGLNIEKMSHPKILECEKIKIK
jgi:hypothetical protein